MRGDRRGSAWRCSTAPWHSVFARDGGILGARCRRRTWRGSGRGLTRTTRGDLDFLVELYDPEAVFETLLLGTHHGNEAIRVIYEENQKTLSGYDVVPVELIDAEDLVVAVAQAVGSGPASGIAVDEPFAFVFTFRGERVIREQVFLDRGGSPGSRGAVGVGDVGGKRGVVRARLRGVQDSHDVVDALVAGLRPDCPRWIPNPTSEQNRSDLVAPSATGHRWSQRGMGRASKDSHSADRGADRVW